MLFNVAYLAALLLASPLLAYRSVRQGKYRRGWGAKLTGRVNLPTATGPRVWFHAVSVGEINLLGGIVAELLRRRPDLDVVVSTTTETGLELARKRFPPERVFYCPLDFTWAVHRTLRQVRPDVLVLAELEVWPNLIRSASESKIPVAVINGRLSESSHRGYTRVRRLVAPTFARLGLVAVQDATYAERFASLGTDSHAIHVTGSTKFDDAPTDRNSQSVAEFRRLVGAHSEHAIFVAGSTQEGEEAAALEAYGVLTRSFERLRMIIVPRHAERFDAVAAQIERAGFRCQRRSTLAAPLEHWDQQTVVLVDSIGELRSWWGLADVAFVGGSLGDRGGQNMLEPAGYGAAVCFGPNTRNFRDIVDALLRADAAEVVTDADGLAVFVGDILNDPRRATTLGSAARRVIAGHRGATARTIDCLEKILPPTSVR